MRRLSARAPSKMELETRPPKKTWSSEMPAYAGTIACPDPRYREGAVKKMQEQLPKE